MGTDNWHGFSDVYTQTTKSHSEWEPEYTPQINSSGKKSKAISRRFWIDDSNKRTKIHKKPECKIKLGSGYSKIFQLPIMVSKLDFIDL